MLAAMQPIPILFLSWYSGLGGGETDLLTLAAGLDPTRWTPHLLLPRPGPLGERWQAAGWPMHLGRWRGASTLFVPAIWARFPFVRRLEALLQHEQIGLIHSDYHSLPFAAAAAQRLHLPVSWTCHGWWFQPRPWQRAFFRAVPGVARSQAIRAGFLGMPPFMPSERLPVIYSGVDTARFRPGLDGAALRAEAGVPAAAPVVAMIARFQPVKGHHTFQAMARQVLAQVPDAHFLIAGEETFGVASDEAYRTRTLEAAQADPLLRERLHYLGFRHDVERVLAAADVYVCASDFESYGKANLEAMACGLPVVSTNRGGPSETLADGETGYLVPPSDAAALAARVVALLHDAALRAQMGAAGRDRVERLFAAQASADAYAAWFERLLRSDLPPVTSPLE